MANIVEQERRQGTAEANMMSGVKKERQKGAFKAGTVSVFEHPWWQSAGKAREATR